MQEAVCKNCLELKFVKPSMIILLIIIVLLFTLAAELIRYVIYRKSMHFTCPKCKTAFKPTLKNFLLSGTSNSASAGKMLTCPKCGKREFIEPEKDRL